MMSVHGFKRAWIQTFLIADFHFSNFPKTILGAHLVTCLVFIDPLVGVPPMLHQSMDSPMGVEGISGRSRIKCDWRAFKVL